MKRWIRALALAMVLICWISSPLAAVAAQVQEAPMDFILVVDTSGSTSYTDEEAVCEEAARMFINMVPFDNARVAVIAFGNLDRRNAYVFSDQNKQRVSYADYDRYLVHELVPLQEMPDEESKAEVRKLIGQLGSMAAAAAADNPDGHNDSHTPMGLAALAAIDILERNGTAKNNACIVLMTDARITSGDNYVTDKDLFDDYVARTAAKNGWPVYSIELNDDGENSPNGEERKRLSDIAIQTGATFDIDSDGTISDVERGNQVVAQGEIGTVIHALQCILARFCGGNTATLQTDKNGIAEYPVEIEEMTAEKTIIVYGEHLENVEMLDESGNSLQNLSDMITIRDGNHMCIKLICPEYGRRTVRVYAASGTDVQVYEGSTANLNLELFTRMQLDQTMKRNEEFTVEAYFTYMGREFRDNEYYTHSTVPVLTVYDSLTDEPLACWNMEGSPVGYAAKVCMSELPEGTYYAQASLTDQRFDNQEKRSNPLYFGSVEKHVEIRSGVTKVKDKEVCVGDAFKIDLNAYFRNPDNSVVTYKLLYNDRELFETTVEGGYMTVDPGMCPGEYDLVLLADDENLQQDKDLRIPMKLTVTNNEIEGPQKLVLSINVPAGLQKWLGAPASQVGLAEIYGDPDSQEIVFSECIPVEGDSALCSDQWTVFARKQGTTVFKVVMTDGVLNAEGERIETERELTVTVKTVWGLFFEKTWKAIAAILILSITAAVLYFIRRMDTRFRDRWMVTVSTQSMGAQQCSEPVDLAIFRRERISLVTLMDQGIEPCLDLLQWGGNRNEASRVRNVLDFWKESDDMKNVFLYPSRKPVGFVIAKRKMTKYCKIRYNGTAVVKRRYISGAEELEVCFEKNDMRLVLRMHRVNE